MARCGNPNQPCDLHIELFLGHFGNVTTLLQDYDEDIVQLQQDIISLRLQSVFGLFKDEEKGRRIVKQYEETEQIRRTISQKSKLSTEEEEAAQRAIAETTNQLHTQEQILKNMFQDYYHSTPRQPQLLTEAMEYQVRVVQPLVEERRHLLYKTMYVAVNNDRTHSRLWQFGQSNDIDEFNTAEPPRVIHYKT